MVKNVTEIKNGIKKNVAIAKIQKNVCKKDYIRNRSKCNCENGKYLPSIIDYSSIRCDKIIETTKTVKIKVFWQKVFQ